MNEMATNKLTACVSGNLGRDAEVTATKTGKTVAKVSIAVNGPNDRTEWVDVAIWGNRGKGLAPHLTKGKLIGLECRRGITG